jgi:hypothetical protein
MNTVVPNPTKELTVNFPIDVVKKAIRDSCRIKNKFTMNKDNDILNTFVIHYSIGVLLNDYVISISLIQISETQTKILCEVTQLLGNTHSTIIASGLKMRLDEFLEIMSKFLSGELKIREASQIQSSDISTQIPQKKNKHLGCIVPIVIIIIIWIVAALIYHYNQ